MGIINRPGAFASNSGSSPYGSYGQIAGNGTIVPAGKRLPPLPETLIGPRLSPGFAAQQAANVADLVGKAQRIGIGGRDLTITRPEMETPEGESVDVKLSPTIGVYEGPDLPTEESTASDASEAETTSSEEALSSSEETKVEEPKTGGINWKKVLGYSAAALGVLALGTGIGFVARDVSFSNFSFSFCPPSQG